MKSALITGITGQDGSYLAELLLSKGYKVSGLVRRLSTPNLENIQHISDKINLLSGDLLDQGSLADAIYKSEPAEIYNLAGGEFNINSPKQIGEVLFHRLKLPMVKKTRKTKDFSTSVEVLEELAKEYDLPQKILEEHLMK